MLVGPYLAAPVLACIGTFYPAYATAQAVTSKEPEALTRWCHYWLVFAALSLVMPVVDMVGVMLPFFYEAKLAFMVWLVYDKTKGATYLCQKYLEPFLAQHQAAIDENIEFIFSKVKSLKMDDVRALAEWVQATANGNAKLASGLKAAKEAVKGVQDKVGGMSPPEQADKPMDPDEPVDVSEETAKKDK